MPNDPIEPSAADVPDAGDPIETIVKAVGKPRRRRQSLLEWVIILLVAAGVSFLLRAYVVQTYWIPSASMEPTLMIGDHVLVSKLSVTWGTIHRGDVVVFRAPEAAHVACQDNLPVYVKRVIGLPGDHLTSKGNTIYVNGKPLDENWPHTEPLGSPIGNVTVPAHSYFMMGDNHADSCDSRSWGPLPASAIIGKVFVRIWPLSRIGPV